MSVRERVVRGKVNSDHLCQFFDTDESRGEAVAAYVADGLRAGEPVVLVTRPAHSVSITHQLEAAGIGVEREVEQGRLLVKDAFEMLARISPRGTPSAAAFDQAIGAVVRRLAESGRVRAYGEMVDILAQRGELDETLAVEEMWNRLGEDISLSLMCGYSAAHFVSTSTHRALRDICAAHTDVRRNQHDALANWLLTTSHNPIASTSRLSH